MVYLMEVKAERIASSVKPGQFLIVRPSENGERIPLTVCDFNVEEGTVTIVTQIAGVSTDKICKLGVGESFSDVVGPLGNPSDFMHRADADLKNSVMFLLRVELELHRFTLRQNTCMKKGRRLT